jgi:hypothetical protein
VERMAEKLTKTLLKLYQILPKVNFSDLPIENFVESFLAGNAAGGGGETNVAGLAGSFSAELGGFAEQAPGGDVLEVALGEFLFDAAQVAGDSFPALFAAGETLFSERLGFDGAQILDEELMLPTPINERGFGDVYLRGDAVKAETLSPKLNEPRDGFLIFHNTFLRGPSLTKA